MSKKPLIVEDVKPGQAFDHDGSIVFKNFVPDGVEATARDGGVILELGGGNNLKLNAMKTSQNLNSVNISGNGISIVSGSGNSGSVININGRVIIGGREIAQSFGNASSAPDIQGVTVKGPLGDNVSIATDGSVKIEDAGAALTVHAAGSLKAGNIGDSARIKTRGNLSAGNVGDSASVSADGSLNAGNLGDNGNFQAGGSVRANVISTNTTVRAGGSLNAASAAKGARLVAGGSINLNAGADPDVFISAGGSIRIAGGKKARPDEFNPRS